QDLDVQQILNSIDSFSFRLENMLAVDEFNYIQGASATPVETIRAVADDLVIVNQGVSLKEDISEIAGNVTVNENSQKKSSLPELHASELFQFLSKPASG